MAEIIIILIENIISLFSIILVRNLFDLLPFNRWLMIIFGCIVGGVSVFIYPDHVISILWLRNLNLIITPFLVAGLVQWLDERITGFEKIPQKDYTFWDIYWLTLSFMLIRYFFAVFG